MLKDLPLFNTLIINVMLGIIWHYATFFVCIFRHKNAFSPDRKMFRPHKWERDGKIYSDILKINRWKDHLPQHIGKNGFSKDHLDEVSPEYLDEFILETCRGEWNHRANCWFAAVLFLLNRFWLACLLTVFLLLGNLPFAAIQRYNRFRLQKLKKALLRKAERETRKMKVPAPTAEDLSGTGADAHNQL